MFNAAGEWRDGASNKIMREPSKVVQIVLPAQRDHRGLQAALQAAVGGDGRAASLRVVLSRLRLTSDQRPVMTGLVPAIHDFAELRKTWMPAPSAGMTSGDRFNLSRPSLGVASLPACAAAGRFLITVITSKVSMPREHASWSR